MFCTECLAGYKDKAYNRTLIIFSRVCPYRCPNPTFIAAQKLVVRAINELKAKCKCGIIIPLDQYDKHFVACQKPKCACIDCKVAEEDIKTKYKCESKAFCSIACKYTYLITKQLDKTGTPDVTTGLRSVLPANFAAEARKVIQQMLKDSDCVPSVVNVSVVKPVDKMVDIPVKVAPAPPVVVHQPPPPIIPSQPTEFKWDSNYCATNIVLSDMNLSCFLMEGGYCFRTVVGTVGFMGGVHYWEIHADGRTENELKIGVASKNTFNLNTV